MFTETFLDKRFAALPQLLREATNPNATRSRVCRFMEELLQADDYLFRGALLFLSRAGHSFVLVQEVSGPFEQPRSWLRWPLHRLFRARRACSITNPVTGERALAVAFSGTAERYVVVAPLAVRECDPAQQTFLDVLQNITSPEVPQTAAGDRVPRFVLFATDGTLSNRIRQIAAQRGWPLANAPTFGHVLLELERDNADVVLLEECALVQQLGALRAARHAAKISDAPIVYFCASDPGQEVRTLCDECVVGEVSDMELLTAMKNGALLVSGMRRQALRSEIDRLEPELRRAHDAHELAQICARGAYALGADVVAVMLADKSGSVHSAHIPEEQPLSDEWPMPFVTGESITYSHAAERFFEEAFDDREQALSAQALQPLSAAALPIADRSRVGGTLVAFSTQRQLFEPEFEALSDLCERTACALTALREPASTAWRQAAVDDVLVELYQGARAGSVFRMASDDAVAAIVAIDGGDKREAARIANELLREPQRDLRLALNEHRAHGQGLMLAIVRERRMVWACEGFCVPLRVPLSGPVAAQRRAQTSESGVLLLEEPCVTLLYSSEFAAQVDTAELVGAVQRELRGNHANVGRLLPELAQKRQRLAFAAITMPACAADARHQPALL